MILVRQLCVASPHSGAHVTLADAAMQLIPSNAVLDDVLHYDIDLRHYAITVTLPFITNYLLLNSELYELVVINYNNNMNKLTSICRGNKIAVSKQLAED